MRICYVLLSPTFGMHQYTADLTSQLLCPNSSSPHDVHLVTTASYPRDRYSSIVTVHTPVTMTNTGLSHQSLQVRAFRQVLATITELRPGLVHFTGPHLWNAMLVRELGRRGIPTVHTIHDLDPHHGARGGRLLYLWNWLVVRYADHILVHGATYRQRLIAKGLKPGRVTYTPLLHLFLSAETLARLNLDTSEPLKAQADTPDNKPFALFFGRMEKYKGVDTLLAAYSLMTGANGFQGTEPGPGLVLAGTGPLSTIWPGKLPAGVEVRNWLVEDEEAMELFRRCSLVVLPYVDATQSALVAAAYYFGKPVVVTRTGALAEYVEDGKTGFVVEPNHPPSIARVLATALASPARLQEMGEAGQLWYKRQRTRETATLTGLYERMGNQRLTFNKNNKK